MDEHFWSTYSEDIDYYFRSILQGCHVFRASDHHDRRFISHGESLGIPANSATMKSSKGYRKLIENTKNSKFWRDAYLCKKWGGGFAKSSRDFLNSNKFLKAILRRKSLEHEYYILILLSLLFRLSVRICSCDPSTEQVCIFHGGIMIEDYKVR